MYRRKCPSSVSSYHYSPMVKNHICVQQKSWANWEVLFSTMKVASVFQSLAESVLFFLCFCLTSHRLLPLPAESRESVFFRPSLWCLSVVWHPCPDNETMWEEEKASEKERDKDRNAVRQQSSTAEYSPSLCSAHCLRYATMHTKYNHEWLKQTQRKQIWTSYSSWLPCFLLPSLHVICCPSTFLPAFFLPQD